MRLDTRCSREREKFIVQSRVRSRRQWDCSRGTSRVAASLTAERTWLLNGHIFQQRALLSLVAMPFIGENGYMECPRLLGEIWSIWYKNIITDSIPFTFLSMPPSIKLFRVYSAGGRRKTTASEYQSVVISSMLTSIQRLIVTLPV